MSAWRQPRLGVPSLDPLAITPSSCIGHRREAKRTVLSPTVLVQLHSNLPYSGPDAVGRLCNAQRLEISFEVQIGRAVSPEGHFCERRVAMIKGCWTEYVVSGALAVSFTLGPTAE